MLSHAQQKKRSVLTLNAALFLFCALFALMRVGAEFCARFYRIYFSCFNFRFNAYLMRRKSDRTVHSFFFSIGKCIKCVYIVYLLHSLFFVHSGWYVLKIVEERFNCCIPYNEYNQWCKTDIGARTLNSIIYAIHFFRSVCWYRIAENENNYLTSIIFFSALESPVDCFWYEILYLLNSCR